MATRSCAECATAVDYPDHGRGKWARWCSSECQEAARQQSKAQHPPCEVEGCHRRTRTKQPGQCETHYYRMRRNGTLALTNPQRLGRSICMVDECTAVDSGPHGLCAMHHTRMRRHGDVHTKLPPAVRRGADNCTWKGEDAGYKAVHDRVRTRRGPASLHPCADCGGPARHWSYDHNDPNERAWDENHGLPYGSGVEHYSPRCVPCHKVYDLTVRRRHSKA